MSSLKGGRERGSTTRNEVVIWVLNFSLINVCKCGAISIPLYYSLTFLCKATLRQMNCFAFPRLISETQKESVYGLWLSVSSFLLPPLLRVGDLKGGGVLKVIQVGCVSS